MPAEKLAFFIYPIQAKTLAHFGNNSVLILANHKKKISMLRLYFLTDGFN
jgi:hypothetical protein